MALDEEGVISVGRWWVIIAGGHRLAVVHIIRGQLMVKLNEALALGDLRALVLTKFRPVFHCGVLNVYLVILLIKYYVNGDVSVPLWNWAAINCPISHRLGLAERHLVLCPFLTDVQLDIDGFSDAVQRMRHIRIFFVERG